MGISASPHYNGKKCAIVIFFTEFSDVRTKNVSIQFGKCLKFSLPPKREILSVRAKNKQLHNFKNFRLLPSLKRCSIDLPLPPRIDVNKVADVI